jgi:ABC-2 type transport system permease protein
MVSILKKELNSFFSSLIGYIAIIVFLLICGLFMWVFDNNILEYGYANLDKFFLFSPWVMMFLLPAITMRSFSDEFKSGTIELLSTLPLKEKDIILGKFLASFILVIFSILPTLLYVFTIYNLSKGNIDSGGILGSYVGLLFLSGAFTAVGLFCSSLTSNQVIAFILAVFANFILYTGFESFSRLDFLSGGADYIISQLGMQFHYNSISRGLLDTRDIVYFLSVIALFIVATQLSLNKRKWN